MRRDSLLRYVSFFLFLWSCATPAAHRQEHDNGWLRLEAGAFSVYAPSGWEFHQKQGVDSYVGEFAGEGIVLKFDYGQYSSPLDEAKEPKYAVALESIGGHKAKVVYPRVPGHGVTGIYFKKITGSDALCLWGQDLTATQQELVLKMFETIRFGGPIPYVVPPPPAREKNMQ